MTTVIVLVLSLVFALLPTTAAYCGEIHDAVIAEDNEIIQRILAESPAELNSRDSTHKTPLYLAAENGHADMARMLLDQGADLTLGDADNSRPIHLAAIGGHTDVAELLRARGANLNAQDDNGTTPLMFAITARQYPMAIWLLENDADPNLATSSGLVPLHYAAARGADDVVVKLLERGAEVNSVDPDEDLTALHYAAMYGRQDVIGTLLDAGAEIEAVNDRTRTPLLLVAREQGEAEVAQLLLDRGANVNASDASDDTPLSLAAWRGFGSLVDLLLDRGAALPADSVKLHELLTYAAEYNLTKLFHRLVDVGASLDIPSRTAGTLLHAAAQGGADEIVEILLQRGQDINATDLYGKTALHYATEHDQRQTVALLHSHGASINVRSLAGWSPFNVAGEAGRDSMMIILQAYGADTSPVAFPRLSGPYLGQKPPGSTPEFFALDIASTNQFEHGCITFSPDGQEAYWTSSIKPEDSPYTNGFIMTSRIADGHWTKPQLASFSKLEYHDDIPVISPDGERLYFISRREPPGIWYMEREDDRWSEPVHIEGGPNTQRPYWQFSVMADLSIYFASRGDIWVSRYENGTYLDAEPLGSTINTEYGESRPCMPPDESFLIFNADSYPDSLGGDGFRVAFKDRQGNWGRPQQLRCGGKMLTGSCPVLSPDGKYLFYNNLDIGVTNFFWVKTEMIEALRQASLSSDDAE